MSKVLRIRITLLESNPPIWRQVLVPADYSLYDLHEVIQVAMGWRNSHLHQFIRKTPRNQGRSRTPYDPNPFEFPPPGIQVFSPGEDPMGGELEMDGEDESMVEAGSLLTRAGSKLLYEYDFGDCWQHEIRLVKKVEATPEMTVPSCEDGQNAGPPEDCGGIYGYANLLEILADPEHPDHEEYEEWLPKDFDPSAFDRDEVNRVLARF